MALTSKQVQHFVYELRDPRPEPWHPESLHLLEDGLHPQAFYVGKSKTDQRRLRRHIQLAENGGHPCHRCHVIRQILAAGMSPELIIIEYYLDEAEALTAEARHASRYPKERLTNAMEAGITGWSPTAEARAKLSATNKGKVPPPHVREAQRRAVTGTHRTPAQKERLREAMTGREFTEEHRANLSAAYARRGPEVIAKISASMKGRRTKLTPDGEQTLIEMTLRGCSSAEIGYAVGLTQSHTRQVINDLIGLGKLPRRVTHAERVIQAAEIYNGGGGAMDVVVALELGAKSSGYAILQAAQRAGLITRISPYMQPRKINRTAASTDDRAI